jgi:hypothetical protein
MNNSYQHSVNQAFGLSNQQETLKESDKSGRVSRIDTAEKRTGSATEHALRKTDLEVYALACLKLLQHEQFFEAFRLLRTANNQLLIKAPEQLTLYETQVAMLKNKLVPSFGDEQALLDAEWHLVTACLLYPMGSSQCLQALSALEIIYGQDDRSWALELSNAFRQVLIDLTDVGD